jgi:hypothetical protein
MIGLSRFSDGSLRRGGWRFGEQTSLGYHHSDCSKADSHAPDQTNTEHVFLLEINSDEPKDTVPNAGVAAREQT